MCLRTQIFDSDRVVYYVVQYLSIWYSNMSEDALLRIVLYWVGFNDMSTLMGHFVPSPRESKKRDRRDSRGEKREGQGRKRNRHESGETEAIKTFPLYPYLLQGWQALPNCKPISFGRPSDVRYTTPSPHPLSLQGWWFFAFHIYLNFFRAPIFSAYKIIAEEYVQVVMFKF